MNPVLADSGSNKGYPGLHLREKWLWLCRELQLRGQCQSHLKLKSILTFCWHNYLEDTVQRQGTAIITITAAQFSKYLLSVISFPPTRILWGIFKMEALVWTINSICLSTFKAFLILYIMVRIMHSLPMIAEDATLESKGMEDEERDRNRKCIPQSGHSNHKIHLLFLLASPYTYIMLPTETFQVCFYSTCSSSLPLVFQFSHHLSLSIAMEWILAPLPKNCVLCVRTSSASKCDCIWR